jgi:hypothetical protein
MLFLQESNLMSTARLKLLRDSLILFTQLADFFLMLSLQSLDERPFVAFGRFRIARFFSERFHFGTEMFILLLLDARLCALGTEHLAHPGDFILEARYLGREKRG